MENKNVIPIEKNKRFKKNKRVVQISVKRIVLICILVIATMAYLLGRIWYLQFVEGDYLKEREYSQSIASSIIAAKRGTIYDSNKKAIAISANVDTVSVNPKYLVPGDDSDEKNNETAIKEYKEKIAKAFSEIFTLDYNKVLEQLNSTKDVEIIAEKVENDKVEKLRKWQKDNKIYSGINVDEDTKRYYPYNNLASQVIGFCGTDNQGLEGLEAEYDSILRGTNGKITTAISVTQEAIPDQDEKYIAPKNGSNLYLTIDSNIQAIAEKYLKQAVEENQCKRGGNVIIEDPTTGKILAMATYPDYNLNEPFTPNDSIKEGWETLDSQTKNNKLFAMWRNKAVVDTYEPGSTFKTITASIALEENITETDIEGDFYCSGSQTVDDSTIYCANTSGHGSQSLRHALENSCNPALIQLGSRIGKTLFYKYLRSYGFFNDTGIDLPSEGTSGFWDEEDVGPVELATMSFGQRFTITPMQLVKAVSAIANGGVMVTPHLVDKIENTDTGTIETINTNEEKQVISKETADSLKDIMKDVVEEGGGTYAQVSGYTIGGKTGTSEADPAHPENGYVASFLAIAPVENTKLVVLLTLYAPQSSNYYGGRIAAPAVSQILTEVLPYLDIPSNNSGNNDYNELVTVPNLVNKTIQEAKSIMEENGLTYKSNGNVDDVIVEQVPKSGTQLTRGGIVKLYTKGNDQRVSQTVPDLKDASFAQAKVMLEAKNLNISSSGSGVVIAQDPKAGSQVDEGTVINVKLQNASSTSQN